MSIAALSPCTYPGCPELVTTGRCVGHRKRADAMRGSARARGYIRAWDEYRVVYLRAHPFCVGALHLGQLVPALVVDHKVPHKGDMQLFWDPTNHQGLCTTCHNVKTATYDGGFGR